MRFKICYFASFFLLTTLLITVTNPLNKFIGDGKTILEELFNMQIKSYTPQPLWSGKGVHHNGLVAL